MSRTQITSNAREEPPAEAQPDPDSISGASTNPYGREACMLTDEKISGTMTGLEVPEMRVKCRQCGERFTANKAEVARGNGRFCSRSCAATYGNIRRATGRTVLTYAEKKTKYGETFMIGQIVARIQGRARKRGVLCDLTPADFREMWDAQGGRCFYSGVEMTLGLSTRTERDPDQCTVDRKDPSEGYTRSNVVLCTLWVNSAKGQMSLREFRRRVRALAKRR